MKDLNKLIETSDFLPPAFQLLPRLLLLLDDPEVNSEELVRVIRVDPGLSADVLRVSNSAALAGECPVETLQEAVVRLGLREVYHVTMKVIASPVLLSPGPPEMPSGFDLWTHSLATATAAELLALERREDAEIVFTAGLLHDIGKAVMAERLGREYGELIDRARTDRIPCFEAEQKAYGIDHAALGARLLKRWNFPDRIIAAVQHHHNPTAARGHDRTAAFIHAANIIAHRIGVGFDLPDYVTFPDPASFALIDLEPEHLEALEAATLEKFKQEQAAFR